MNLYKIILVSYLFLITIKADAKYTEKQLQEFHELINERIALIYSKVDEYKKLPLKAQKTYKYFDVIALTSPVIFEEGKVGWGKGIGQIFLEGDGYLEICSPPLKKIFYDPYLPKNSVCRDQETWKLFDLTMKYFIPAYLPRNISYKEFISNFNEARKVYNKVGRFGLQIIQNDEFPMANKNGYVVSDIYFDSNYNKDVVFLE